MTTLTRTKDIQAWLDKHSIENYTINSDLSVDVEGDVNLTNKNLKAIPVRFHRVEGDFNCSWNQLKTLTHCPQIVGKNFNSSRNQLTSLIGAPQSVGGHFICAHNQLASLQYAPNFVGGNFNCALNLIASLEFCPQNVGNDFYCRDNPGLGHFQDILDFSIIKAEHQRIQNVLGEQQQLNDLLGVKNLPQTASFKL